MQKFYRKEMRLYRAGETVFREGEDSDAMFYVNWGHFQVFKTRQGTRRLEEVELGRIGPNDIFGEMGLITGGLREASVRAIEPSEVTVITREMFNDQCAALPTWGSKLLQVLVSRIKSANARLVNN